MIKTELSIQFYIPLMNLIMRKLVFGVSDQVGLEPACSATETS